MPAKNMMKLKEMFVKLMEQMDMMLKLLTTVVSKLAKWQKTKNINWPSGKPIAFNSTPEKSKHLYMNKILIGIMMISETHITNRHYLRILKYNLYHTTHPDGNARGGTALIIGESTKHFEREKFSKDYLQATTVAEHYQYQLSTAPQNVVIRRNISKNSLVH